MGGCASKPKELKEGSADQPPEPAPESVELLEKKEEDAGIGGAPVAAEEKIKEDAETAIAYQAQVAVEEVKEIEGEAIDDSNPPHDQEYSQIAEQVKQTNDEGIRDSSQSKTETETALHHELEVASQEREPQVLVITNESAEEAKSEAPINPTAVPTEKVETEHDEKVSNIIPATEEEHVQTERAVLEKKPGEKSEAEKEKKQQEGRTKPQPAPEDNPFLSFISSLMGQKR